MKELRGQERRNFDSRQRFPFLDNTGKIILEDRRSLPDRRLNNIRLELVTLPLDDIPPDWLH
jgi:hypothetical protein